MRACLRRAGPAIAEQCETGWFCCIPDPGLLLPLLNRAWARLGGAGMIEQMCHPGLVDDGLRACSSNVEPRVAKLAVLCSDRPAATLEAAGITLIGLAVLKVNAAVAAVIDKPGRTGSLLGYAAAGEEEHHGD